MSITRRDMIKTTATVGVASRTTDSSAARAQDHQPAAVAAAQTEKKAGAGGRLRQSVCQWCFKNWEKEEFCANAQKLGLVGIDLVGPDWFDSLKKHNLIGTMTPSHGISKGLNRKEHWD